MKHPSPDGSDHLSPDGPDHSAHNFDSISPSAYALLLMKSLMPIPYAREAAALLPSIDPNATAPSSLLPFINPNAADPSGTRPDIPDQQKGTPGFWARALHFESRYFSVDQLLSDLTATNILELSSGFSFRGLALTRTNPVFYIDTDLPKLIETKRRFIEALHAPAAQGHYELQPLNALDTAAFNAIAQKFPFGEITIINEGLLVYLDTSEKERLCHNIREILQQRGGSWITGDIYLRNPNGRLFEEGKDAFSQFLEQHNIEENKFGSFDEARDFFTRMGFIVDREATPDFASLSTVPRLIAACNPKQLEKLRQAGRRRIHAVWRLSLP